METSWQDLVLALIQTFFCINLIPMIRAGSGKETPLFTSITTCVGLLGMAATFLTIPLYYSALTCSLISISWGVLAFQRFASRTQKNGTK
jgi:hypothetical protein